MLRLRVWMTKAMIREAMLYTGYSLDEVEIRWQWLWRQSHVTFLDPLGNVEADACYVDVWSVCPPPIWDR